MLKCITTANYLNKTKTLNSFRVLNLENKAHDFQIKLHKTELGSVSPLSRACNIIWQDSGRQSQHFSHTALATFKSKCGLFF